MIAYPATGAILTSFLQQAEAHKWNYSHRKGRNLKFGDTDFPFSHRKLFTQREPNLCNFTAHFPVSSSDSARCSTGEQRSTWGHLHHLQTLSAQGKDFRVKYQPGKVKNQQGKPSRPPCPGSWISTPSQANPPTPTAVLRFLQESS